MLPTADLTSLPLAEGTHSSPVLQVLRDGVVIGHGALIHGGTPMGDPAAIRRSSARHCTAVDGRRLRRLIAGGPTHA